MKWQPIETAPRDGRAVLVWHGCEGVAIAYFDGRSWVGDFGDSSHARPDELTHWMPLPEPPK